MIEKIHHRVYKADHRFQPGFSHFSADSDGGLVLKVVFKRNQAFEKIGLNKSLGVILD
ncbi:MAG: hypothetical protein JKX97_02655 [Candidatus Lindowbacteria bacterium]|nr:hypothetical protein [Candidatus Lindowbacteria bacterium]